MPSHLWHYGRCPCSTPCPHQCVFAAARPPLYRSPSFSRSLALSTLSPTRCSSTGRHNANAFCIVHYHPRSLILSTGPCRMLGLIATWCRSWRCRLRPRLGRRPHRCSAKIPSLCALPLRRSAVPVSVRAAAAVVGCSRLGARCRCGGWLFPFRCAPPLRRSAVPVSVRAATAAVGCFRLDVCCRLGGQLFSLWCALPLWLSDTSPSVRGAAVVVGRSGLSASWCCSGALLPTRAVLLLRR